MRRALAPLVLVIAIAAVQWGAGSRRAPVPMALDEATPPRAIPALVADDAPGSIEELRRRMAAVLEREGVPGAAIALVGRDGPIWIGGVGVADVSSRVAVDASTVFRIASITKSIVGLGVMRLVEQGRLDLDQPLRDAVPDAGIDNAWDDVAPVTLAQVLEHTAGLDDMRFNETFTRDDAMTPAAALAINPRSRRVRWRPGSRPAYSNVGYTLAARAIEHVTGEPFDAWLRREVVVPLGMRDADFRRTDVLAARLATGYVDRGRASPFSPIAHRAAGALLASATDLAGLVQFWLRRGEGGSIVSPAGLERIERAGTLPFPRTDVEYGLGNYGDVAHPVRARGHDGGLPGFASAMRYFPELGLGYVILLNATHSQRAYVELRSLAFAYLVRGRTLPALPALATGVQDRPAAGFYAHANPRHAVFGFLDRAVLGWRAVETTAGVRLDPLIGGAHELVATRDGGYRFRWESGTSVRFTAGRGGGPVLIGAGFGYAEAAAFWPARARVLALTIAIGLLHLAPLWAVGVLGLAVLQRRRVAAPGLLLWPAIAGLCVLAFPRVFVAAAIGEELGDVTPLTVAICASTLGFAIAATASLVTAVRWSRRPDRPSLWRRLVPTATAAAAFAIAVWFAANGIIGLRTWAW
jgi:CubicO group peptidase (beta-lactamase class C family)